MLFETVVQVFDALRNMDVIAGVRRENGGTGLQRAVAQRKAGMHAHHTGDHVAVVCAGVVDEIDVFLNGGITFVLSVAIRDFIAQARTDARLLRSVFDAEQTAADLTEARMVVENCCHAIFDAVDIGDHCAQPECPESRAGYSL